MSRCWACASAPLAITHAIDFGAGDVDVVILHDLFTARKVLPDLLLQMPVRVLIYLIIHLFIHSFIHFKDMGDLSV